MDSVPCLIDIELFRLFARHPRIRLFRRSWFYPEQLRKQRRFAFGRQWHWGGRKISQSLGILYDGVEVFILHSVETADHAHTFLLVSAEAYAQAPEIPQGIRIEQSKSV